MKRKLLLALVLPCMVLAKPHNSRSDDIYRKLEQTTKTNVDMQYMETMHHFRALQRKYYLQYKKERMQDIVNNKRRKVLSNMLGINPGIELNTQGVVGNIMLVNGYAIPSGTFTPYGVVRVVGPVGYVGSTMVAPDMGKASYRNIDDYMKTINSLKNSYYTSIPLPSPGNISGGSLPSLTNLLSSAPLPPPPVPSTPSTPSAPPTPSTPPLASK